MVLLPIVFQDVLQKIATDWSPQSVFPTSGLILCFPGIYGVGKAALHPPALAVLSHTPDGATQTIAWVGKGIVYDTGGLSIKGKVPKHLFFCCLCLQCCFLLEIIQLMSVGNQSMFIWVNTWSTVIHMGTNCQPRRPNRIQGTLHRAVK